MAETSRLGGRIRALRRERNLTQSKLASEVGISATYLNLIEHDRRALPAPLLLKLVKLFAIDLDAFVNVDGGQLETDVLECLGDPFFDKHHIVANDVREVVSMSPPLARALVDLYRAYRRSTEAIDTLGARLSDEETRGGVDAVRLPNEEVNDFIQRHMNFFPVLEAGADAVWATGRLRQEDVYRGLSAQLEQEHHVQVRVVPLAENRGALRRFDPESRVLYLTETLAPRSWNFHLAHQLGMLTVGKEIDRLVDDGAFSNEESRTLARAVLVNYFAGAVLMPYDRILAAAQHERYDVELIGHRFRTSFEQVGHRLTTLRKPGAEGVPFHLVRVDIAGNISKRFSASGMRFARFSGACPRWNVHASFVTPGVIRVQLSAMPDGTTYFEFARAIRRDRGSYRAQHTIYAVGMGCEVRHAAKLVYSDGVDLNNPAAAVPIGVTCRLCDRNDCEQRAFPPLQKRLMVDPNIRGVSPFGSGDAPR